MTPAEARNRLTAALGAAQGQKAGAKLERLRNLVGYRDDPTPEELAATLARLQADIDANHGLIPRQGLKCPDWMLTDYFYHGCRFDGVEPLPIESPAEPAETRATK